MGNNLVGGRKKAKVMKISGESFKLKMPAIAWDVTKIHPGHVLLDAEAVRRFGIRAKPLEPQEQLKPKKVYFLVQLPKLNEAERVPKRTRSAVQISAKDRLESLKLRRSVSEISATRPSSGPLQVKMKLARSQVQRLIEESKDDSEVAEKIIGLCLRSSNMEEEGPSDLYFQRGHVSDKLI